MNENSNIFINKKILIYGLGKSGISSFKFLRGINQVYLFDDNNKIKLIKNYKKNLISLNQIKKSKFDLIVLSPGINDRKCKLSKFLKKNSKIIYTDLDIFYSFNKNLCITITGTNGKTTVTMLTKHLIGDCERTSLLGTVHYDLGARIIPSARTTPEVHDLCRLLSLAKANGCNRTIMEVSSHGVRQKRIHGISFDTAVFLNLTPEHLDYHDGILIYRVVCNFLKLLMISIVIS